MKQSMKDFYSIPIFIISYNRTETLKRCLERFLKDGYANIQILDNHSTNKDHLEYLKSVSVKVHFLQKNYGPRVLWDCGLFDDLIQSQYYVLTDPDVLPVEECPTDYVRRFYAILQQYPEKTKAGFGLKLDDLPDDYAYKWDMIRFESFYWEKRLPFQNGVIYDASIDTTFALYRPGMVQIQNRFYEGIRTGFPYLARHLGWYVHSFGQNEYYKISRVYSTSNNLEAIMHFRKSVAVQSLNLCSGGVELSELLKGIYTSEFIRANVGFKDLSKSIFYLIAKKLAVCLRLR